MLKEKPARAICYLRRSDSKQENSLEQQLAWAISECERRQLIFNASMKMLSEARAKKLSQIGDIFLDDAITGADLERPGFRAFHSFAITSPEITHCLFFHRDRFARPETAEEAVLLEKQILHAGKWTITSGTSCAPRTRNERSEWQDIQLRMEYGAAGVFRPDLAKKILRAQKQNALSGYWSGGRAPYGCLRALFNTATKEVARLLSDGEKVRQPLHKIIVLPGTHPDVQKWLTKEQVATFAQKLKIVRRIHDEYFSDTRGLLGIAKRLNAERIPSPDAGRMRVGREVAGTWNNGNIRCVIEAPVYLGTIAFGRHAEGTTCRYDKMAPAGFRDVTDAEIRPGTIKGKKSNIREYNDWTTSPSPLPFEPIVPVEIWWANFNKLKQRGIAGGLRGVTKHRDPNLYPLNVVCGDCGKRMTGCLGPDKFTLLYRCSTYENEKNCNHNWIERDVAVWFAFNSVKQFVEQLSRKSELNKAVRELLQVDGKSNQSANSDVADLSRELHSHEKILKRVYADTVKLDDDRTRQIAKELYENELAECKRLEREIAEREACAGISGSNIEEEVERTLAVLNQLHLFLDKAPRNQLREVFTKLEVKLLVKFEHPENGRRRNVPVGGTLAIGSFGIPSVNSQPFVPARHPERDKRLLGIGNRGDRI